MGKVGRNEPCHCGSGKKYKNCHQQLDGPNDGGPAKAKNKNIIIGALVIFLIFLAIGVFLNIQSSGNAGPGDAPEGKVWSPEHGHWHNAE